MSDSGPYLRWAPPAVNRGAPRPLRPPRPRCCWKTAKARCSRKRQASCKFCPQHVQMAKNSKVLEAMLAGISSLYNSDWETLQVNMAKALSLSEQEEQGRRHAASVQLIGQRLAKWDLQASSRRCAVLRNLRCAA